MSATTVASHGALENTSILPHPGDCRFVRLARPGERCRPATLNDVIVDRGEFWGDGVPRTFGGHPFEPLDWGWLHRQNARKAVSE